MSCPFGFGRRAAPGPAPAEEKPATSCPAGFGGGGGGCPFATRKEGADASSTGAISWSTIAEGLPRMPLSLLRGHAALGLIAVKGIVFDVQEEATFPSIKPLLGHDITKCLAKRVPVDHAALEDYLDQVRRIDDGVTLQGQMMPVIRVFYVNATLTCRRRSLISNHWPHVSHQNIDGLSFDELKELEVVARGFIRRYKAIGVLSQV